MHMNSAGMAHFSKNTITRLHITSGSLNWVDPLLARHSNDLTNFRLILESTHPTPILIEGMHFPSDFVQLKSVIHGSDSSPMRIITIQK